VDFKQNSQILLGVPEFMYIDLGYRGNFAECFHFMNF